MRLIDANLLDKKYREVKAKNGFGEDEQISHKDILSFTLLALDSLPTVEAVPVVHAKWIDRIVDNGEIINPWDNRYKCSKCSDTFRSSWFNYCPNCGAKMDGEIGDASDATTVDSVEVVRCKDCFWKDHEYENWCCFYRINITDNDFCSKGEKNLTE